MRRRAFGPLVGFVASIALSAQALAHEGGPRLIVEPEEVRPGGVLTIRVEDLPPERTTQISLARNGESVPLASVLVDPEGHATVYIEIPADIGLGSYEVAAVADGVIVAPARLVIDGQRILPAGEPGEKGEDDLLLIALPSGWQQSLSGPAITARPLTETLPAGSGSRPVVEGIVAAIAIAFGLGSVALVVATRLYRRAGAGR